MPTLAKLKATIADDLHRSDLTTQIAEAIDSAVRFYERERLYFLEGQTTFTATASTAYHAVPSDYKDTDSVLVTISGSKDNLIRRSFNEIDEIDTGQYTGTPSWYAYYQDQFRWYPVPNADYPITLSYHKTLDLPSASGSNAWTTAAFDVLRFRSEWDLNQHYLHNPERAAICKASEGDAYASLENESNCRISSGRLRRSGW
jgi:hypothetical protein